MPSADQSSPGADDADNELPESAARGLPLVSEAHSSVYRIPTEQPEADGTLTWDATTVLVVHLHAGNSVGTGWTYGSRASQVIFDDVLRHLVVGQSPDEIPRLHETMIRACRNLGCNGIVAHAISAVDIALWDLKARLLESNLADLFGSARDSVPLYGSGGFTTYSDATTVSQLEHWINDFEITKVKIKIGESWGTCEARDCQRVDLARKTIGDQRELFVDANGGYSVKQAIRMGRHFYEHSGVTWFEEPVSSNDLNGLRTIRDAIDVDIAAGEYGHDEGYFARMISSQAIDCLQLDVTRCGGYTSFVRICGLAYASELDVSAHCAPSLHASVAMAITNLRHIEFFHDHEKVDELLFEGLPTIRNGCIEAPIGRGHGMSLKPSDAAEYRIS